MLENLIETLTPWFEEWGLVIVFVATFIESSIVIASFLPGESVLLLGGFFATPAALGAKVQTAPLDLSDVILVGFAGALLGDLVGYAIGRGAGDWIVRHVGRFFLLPPKRLPMMEAYFRSYGARAILIGRFAPFLRSIRTLVAGTVRMPLLRFLLPDIVGAAIWVAAISVTGFLLGESWRVAQRYMGAGGAFVLLLLIVLFALTWKRMGVRVERELNAQGAAADAPPGDPPGPASAAG